MKSVQSLFYSTFALVLFLCCEYSSSGQSSAIKIHELSSPLIQSRNIRVLLPPDYSPSNRYPVLYMHDGQMLFDSTITWNSQEWMVDETTQMLTKENKTTPFIVVGIDNHPSKRRAEYFPEKALKYLPEDVKSLVIKNELQGDPLADEYLAFLVHHVKPFIDSTYSTQSDMQSTAIGGSSMGGLISMYAYCEYPQVFGHAICMSTHWPGTGNVKDEEVPLAFQAYLLEYLPKANGKRKIYFDYGTETLDKVYAPFQLGVDEIFRDKRYKPSHFISKSFPGAAHDERSWAKRLHEPLLFVFGK